MWILSLKSPTHFEQRLYIFLVKVEERCCIPECVQTILYQGNVVSESTTPQSFYLRSGDTVIINNQVYFILLFSSPNPLAA